jgi:phage-related protein
MSQSKVSWEIRLYVDNRRRKPVEDFIGQLPEEDRAKVRAAIKFLGEVGNRLREPQSKSLGQGLFELRVRSRRIFYCFLPSRIIVLLHAFTKKTQKTPPGELDIGYKRMEELKHEK